MSAIVTTNKRLENAKRLLNNLSTNREYYYFFLAKADPWTDENFPLLPLDEFSNQNSIYNELLTLKRIGPSDAKIGIRRYNWITNTIYSYYDDHSDLFDDTLDTFRPFYVINSDLNVYKCLWNNSLSENFSPNVITFDGSDNGVVDTSSDEITFNGHGFTDGTKVRYSSGNSTEIGNLISGNSYYIIFVDSNTFQLSETDGGSAIDFSSLSNNGGHTLTQESFELNLFTYTPATAELAVYVNGIRLSGVFYNQVATDKVEFVNGVIKENDLIVFEKRGYSTVEPSSTDVGTDDQIEPLADGYKWKYMYTLSASDATKFLTKNWIPISVKKEDDTSNQWDIQENAVDGIDTIKVIENGLDYDAYITEDDAVAGSTASTINLAASASATNGLYEGCSVFISAGTGVGQLRTIVNYNGGTKVATVSQNWTITPDTSSHYQITPDVIISSNTGSGARARIPISDIDGDGRILSVVVHTLGSGYKDATISLGVVEPVAASFKAIIPPKNGHGWNAERELLGRVSVICSAEFDGSESGQIIAENEFRKTGILKNPLVEMGPIAGATGANNTGLILGSTGLYEPSSSNDFYNGKLITILSGPGREQTKLITDYTGASKIADIEYERTDNTWEPVWEAVPTTASTFGIVANGNLYNQTLELDYSSISGTYDADDLVTQAVSNAQGNIVAVDVVNEKIYLNNIIGTFISGQNITWSTGNASITGVGEQPIIKHEGQIVLLEHRKNVTRSDDQKESFKIILEY